MANEFFLQTLQEEGHRLGIPLAKSRALIREYLQTRIIASLYDAKESSKLSFIGGTSLRLLRGLDRFSEDLDFDNLGLSFQNIKKLFNSVFSRLQREGFEVQYRIKKTNSSGIGEFKFPNILFQLGISSHRLEKLSIKINYTTPSSKPNTELVVLARFGFVQNVLTNTVKVLLSQKIRAIMQRKDAQPRDFYDVVWLLSRNIQPDVKFLRSFGVKNETDSFLKINEIFQDKIKPNLSSFKRRLQPFLLNESHISYLDIFSKIMKKFMP